MAVVHPIDQFLEDDTNANIEGNIITGYHQDENGTFISNVTLLVGLAHCDKKSLLLDSRKDTSGVQNGDSGCSEESESESSSSSEESHDAGESEPDRLVDFYSIEQEQLAETKKENIDSGLSFSATYLQESMFASGITDISGNNKHVNNHQQLVKDTQKRSPRKSKSGGNPKENENHIMVERDDGDKVSVKRRSPRKSRMVSVTNAVEPEESDLDRWSGDEEVSVKRRSPRKSRVVSVTNVVEPEGSDLDRWSGDEECYNRNIAKKNSNASERRKSHDTLKYRRRDGEISPVSLSRQKMNKLNYYSDNECAPDYETRKSPSPRKSIIKEYREHGHSDDDRHHKAKESKLKIVRKVRLSPNKCDHNGSFQNDVEYESLGRDENVNNETKTDKPVGETSRKKRLPGEGKKRKEKGVKQSASIIENDEDHDSHDKEQHDDKDRFKGRKSKTNEAPSREHEDDEKAPKKKKVSVDREMDQHNDHEREKDADPGTGRESKRLSRASTSRDAREKDTREKEKEKEKKEEEEQNNLGVTVYQIEVRFIVYKGLRFCGGVRVLMNCQEEKAYLQLITLMNEVFATYDIDNICFLEPRSAAGVSFCAIPYQDNNKDEKESKNEKEDNHEDEEGLSEKEKQKRKRCKEKEKTRIPMIEHAEVVFCTPEQMVRFKTVIDTLLCAVSCVDNSKPPQYLTDMLCDGSGGEFPQDQQEFLDTCFEDAMEEMPADYDMYAENDPYQDSPYNLRQSGNLNPKHGSTSKSMQMEQPQYRKSSHFQPQQKRVSYQFQQSQTQRTSVKLQQTQQPPLQQPSNHETSSSGKKFHSLQFFDPCPKDPSTNTISCLPCDLGDPYQLNGSEGRVVFCTPACLKIANKSNEKIVFKGKLKIVQGCGGIGFIVRIESVEGSNLYCHSLRRDLNLCPTNEVPFGFEYSTVVCTDGRTTMESFVVAFPSAYQRDQFQHAVSTCKDILGMTSVQSLVQVKGN